MRIRISDPSLAGDLRHHFERSSFTVDDLDAATLEVKRPDAPDDDQARREIELHLRVWRAMHPSLPVEGFE
jgi:hypothetical protein